MRRVVDGLGGFTGRGACTDAERRAALWLHAELRTRGRRWGGGGRGGAVALAGDAVGRNPLLLLFPRRATQHVLAGLADPDLLVVAAYDAPAPRPRPERPLAGAAGALSVRRSGGLRRGGRAAAAARVADVDASWLGAAQLVPTLVLLAALAAALDIALSDYSPGANDNPSGVAVAIALIEVLGDRAALLLVGAGHAVPRAVHDHIRRERLHAQVLEIGPCDDGAMDAALAFALEDAERREVVDRL